MKGIRKTTLGLALRSALMGKLEDAWLYLPDASIPTVDTECLIVSEIDSELSPEEIAASVGFLQEGLDSQTLEGVALCAAQFKDPPPDELLVESFVYYWRFDSWLPKPDAPEPPSPEIVLLNEARRFYDSLGAERGDSSCKAAGCSRGAVSNSLYCRPHHFEMLRKSPCPFNH